MILLPVLVPKPREQTNVLKAFHDGAKAFHAELLKVNSKWMTNPHYIERGDMVSNLLIIGKSVINEPGHAVTVSQSLGVDPSVDSLALDDYDHIELVN